MNLQNLLASFKARPPQGIPPVLAQGQAQTPVPPISYGAGDPPTGVTAQPIAGQPNPNADIVVNNEGYPDPVTPVQHKGMFGIKGTWRDVLGGLGDALVMSKGGDPIYMQRRDKEKIGDITANFAGDPELTIQQLHQNGYGEVAVEYEKRLADAQAAQAKAGQWQSEFELDVAKNNREKAAHEAKVFGTGLTLMSSATDKASWKRARAKAMGYFERAGITPLFDIPETYDPNFKNDLANFGADGMFEVTQENNDVAYNNQTIVARREAAAAQQAAATARLAAQEEKARQDEAWKRDPNNPSNRTAKATEVRTNWQVNPANPRNQPRTGRRQKGGPPRVTPATR